MRLPLVLALVTVACTRPGERPEPSVPQPPTGTQVGETIPAFTAQTIDVTGASEQLRTLDSQKTNRVTVYAMLGTSCPTTQMYLDRLRELEASYRKRGVDFVYVYPNRNDAAERKRAYHKEQRLAGPLIDDEGAKIAVSTLRAQKTAEMLVVDKRRVIRYRGAIDDNKIAEQVTRRHLALALDEILAGKDVTTPVSTVYA
jgi:peroxiredoxin